MKTEERDDRFTKLVENLEEFDVKMDKIRRIKSFLLKAIRDGWKSSGQMNLILHFDHEVVVRLPIGEVYGMQVEVSFARLINGETFQKEWVQMRLLDSSGQEICESDLSLTWLEGLMLNPSPMIDAAAKFCEELGCFVHFDMKVGRFYSMMKYKI